MIPSSQFRYIHEKSRPDLYLFIPSSDRLSRPIASARHTAQPTLFRSKSWDEVAKPDAPKMDFVFTVCDNAANGFCPIWPGQPMTAHWGVADPAAVRGTEKEIERGYRDAFLTLERRISLFLCLPLVTIDKLAIKKEIDKIGRQ